MRIASACRTSESFTPTFLRGSVSMNASIRMILSSYATSYVAHPSHRITMRCLSEGRGPPVDAGTKVEQEGSSKRAFEALALAEKVNAAIAASRKQCHCISCVRIAVDPMLKLIKSGAFNECACVC